MKYFTLAIALLITVSVTAQPPVGSPAPEISLPTASGEMKNLSSLKGKVVLIDFWASWCQPCRQSNRQLKAVYKKYQNKGFEIFGVSIDGNPKAWQYAVKHDGIQWPQVIDTYAGRGNELSQTWGLRWIPSTFLLDKEGNVVASGLEPDKLEKWIKKLL